VVLVMGLFEVVMFRGRFWSGKSVQVGKRLEIRFPTPARLQIRVQRVVEKVRGLSGMIVVSCPSGMVLVYCVVVVVEDV